MREVRGERVSIAAEMAAALSARPLEAYLDRDLLLVYDDEATVRVIDASPAASICLPWRAGQNPTRAKPSASC